MSATPTPSLGFQNFFEASLTGDLTATSTDIPMDNIPNASEGFLVIDPDSESAREVIYYNSKTALKVTCPSVANGRGQDDTTAGPHSQGTTVIMAPVAGMFEALQSGTAIANTAIPARAIDFGGSGTGVWWEEIGHTTLTTAGDLVTVNFAARKYLRVIIRYGSVTNPTTPYLKFNNVGTTTYAFRTWDGTTNSGFSGQPDITLATGSINASDQFYAEMAITNLSTASKTLVSNGLHMNSTAAFAPAIDTIWAMWESTTQVTRIDLFNKSGTGDFGIGAEVIVLGHN